jgi:hypothetical protein
VVKESQMLLGARPPPNREISTAGLHLWEAHAATMAHFVFLVEAPDEASPYRGTAIMLVGSEIEPQRKTQRVWY